VRRGDVATSGGSTNREVEMSKILLTPTSRLICVGGAKATTMAVDIGKLENDVGGPRFQ
jgi:hypothetical protein